MDNSIDAQGLAIFLAQLVFISLIIERAVAQIKALTRNGLVKDLKMVQIIKLKVRRKKM